MAEFERERTVAAGPDAVFDIVADMERIEQWMPPEVSVQPGDATSRSHVGEVHADVEEAGRRTGGRGVVHVRREQLRVEWADRDSPDYTGWLQVAHAGPGRSSVTLHLSFLGDQPENHAGGVEREVVDRMDDALERLASLVAG